MNHFHKIQVCHFQCNISGAGLGGLYHILCKDFQTLGFFLQDIQITADFRIRKILPFQQIHIIDDGCERGFDIVGYVGDQFRLHTLVFQAVFHCGIQSGANVIDVFRHGFLLSG